MSVHLRRLHLHLAPAVVAVAVLAACSGGAAGDGGRAGDSGAPSAAQRPAATPGEPSDVAPGGAQAGVLDPDLIAPERLEPLAGLGECPQPPPPAEGADPGNVPLPPAAVVTGASVQGSLRNVQGYSPRTPVEIMVEYLREEDVTAVNVEDEVFESEVLLARGDLRVFIKSQATCERGSAFVLFASDDPALVPEPANAAP